MKPLLALALAASLVTASHVSAGGMAEPMMEPEVISEETSNSGGFVLPLVLIAIVVAIASNSGDGGTTTTTLGKIAPTK